MINKTGGTSIGNAIGLPRKKHLHVEEVIDQVGEEMFRKAFVFAVVRNPWDKVVSQYKFRIKIREKKVKTHGGDMSISFKEWVKKTYLEKDPVYYNNPRMFASQCDWLKDSKGAIRVNNIIKFESLQEDFKKVVEQLGMDVELPHLNATKKESFADYYDEETVEIVRNWFKEDIERFQYEFPASKV